MNVLLTGGAGYIGSHMAVALAQAGHRPVVLENFCNSKPSVMARVAALSGQAVPLVQADVRDTSAVVRAITEHRIEAVVHFAALKAVGESVAKPMLYFDNNIGGLLSLVRAMQSTGCRQMVFSSSAVVYGDPARVPISEEDPVGYTNAYAQTKLVGEQCLQTLSQSDPSWRVAVLRYFNPVGAHPSGQIGEDPSGIPNNLVPYIAQVAVGRRDRLQVFGSDYATPDGTGVRDYIHIQDLVAGHLASLRVLGEQGSHLVNLGTGRGYSVMEVIDAYARASGRPIPYEVAPRRPGDVATVFTDPTRAQALLGWQAQFGLDDMCRSSWHWQQQNPNGYP
ncbi:GalE UDP-glucose 4-epimerase [Burkholderiales bacterium]